MGSDFIRLPLLFITLCAAQVFILGHIQIFGCAMPLLYLYFVLAMRRNMPKWAAMAWAFAMGITLDIFDNTPGVTAAALTAAAMVQPYLLGLFISREGDDDFTPSMASLGKKPFANYVALSTAGYCTLYFTLEMLSFANGAKWLQCVVGSTVLTAVLILAIDRLAHRKEA